MASDKRRASCYLILRADVRVASDGSTTVRSVSVHRSVKSRVALDWNEVAVRVHVDVPSAIFERITPTATIDVPDDIVVHPIIEATAGEPE